MANTILLKRSSTPGSVPTPGNLTPGELAINYADGNLFFEDLAGNVQTIASTQFVSVAGNVTGGNIITLGQVSATGNITGNYFIGNGALLTGIQSGFLTGTVDDFVGDGSTLAFNLSVIPASENLTSVNINGVSQLKTAYSVVGNVITFTSAPVNGSDIEVTTLSGSATSLANLVNGTTIIDIPIADGNATVSVGGNANVGVFTTTGLVVNGSIEATNGFIGLDATSIANGTANVRTFLDSNVTISAAGNANIVTVTGTGVDVAGTLSASGNVTGTNLIAANAILVNAGNLTTAIVNSGANGVGNIGSDTGYFDTVFAKATSAQYADLAEIYQADAAYAPGTVLDFGGAYEVTISSQDASRRVAGVVSTQPAHLMNTTATGEHLVPLALAGRVPVSVTGTVEKGDMLVSAGNGVARAEPEPKLGTVIGKAVQNFRGTAGVIEVVVGQY